MDWQTGVRYAIDVAKGEINVNRDIRLACQRFINQYENQEWEWVFDPDYPQHVLEFATNLRHTKGPQAGEQMLMIARKYKVVMTVHDAVACIAPEDEAERAKEYVELCMRLRPRWAAELPLNCEAGYGKSYGDC